MIKSCKGFNDLMPQEMASFRHVEAVFLETTAGWGYREVRTPVIEYLYLFTSAGTLTPGKLRRTYSFLDWDGWSGERVVLRPDATIPVARMYSECLGGESQARLAYIANTFMFDDSGKKDRERWQMGAEYIGASSAMADGELVALALEVTDHLKISDVRVRLSHSGLIAALLEHSGLSQEEYRNIFDELLDGNEAAIEKVKDSNPQLARLLSLMLGMNGKSAGYLKNLKALLGEALSGAQNVIDDFIATTEAIQALGVEYEINLAAAKGYEYYTGVIFHILSGDEIIGGGGRYDNLIKLLGGDDTPAAGFALYMDKLVKYSEFEPKESSRATISLINTSERGARKVLALTQRLRKEGYSVVLISGGDGIPEIESCSSISVNDEESTYTLRYPGAGKTVQFTTEDELCSVLARGVDLA